MPGVSIHATFTASSSITATYTVASSNYDAFVVACDGVPQYPPTSADGYSTFNTTNWVANEPTTVTLCSDLDPASTHDVVIFKS